MKSTLLLLSLLGQLAVCHAHAGRPPINTTFCSALVSEAHMAPLSGRVVDAAGKPVPHAFVGLDRGSDLPIPTDENGHFEFKDTPTAGTVLFASDGPRFGTYEVGQEADTVEIVLSEAAPIEDKTAAAERISPGALADWQWGQQWNVPGHENLGEVLVRIRASTPDDWGWSDIVHEMAVFEPTKFLAEEKALRARTSPANQAALDNLLMLARASSKDEAIRAQVQTWLDTQERLKRDASPRTVLRVLEVAEIAQKFDPQVGAMWLNYASEIIEQLGTTGDASGSIQEWGKRAARVSPQTVETLSEEWKPGVKVQLLEGAMHTYSALGDVASARPIFVEMEKLAAQSDAARETITLYGMPHKSSELLPQGRKQLVTLLVTTDLEDALEAAMQLDKNERAQAFLAIARSAIKQNKLDVARKALSAVADIPSAKPEWSAQAAQIALQFDAPLADSLFAKAFRKASPEVNDNFEAWHPSIAPYAKARVLKWPGESRILLERHWILWQALLAKQKGNDAVASGMVGLVEAMAYLSPRRAFEMAEQVPKEGGERTQAHGAIALALLRDSPN